MSKRNNSALPVETIIALRKSGMKLAGIAAETGTSISAVSKAIATHAAANGGNDPEFAALSACVNTLARLEPEALARVMHYLAQRFSKDQP